MRVWQVVVVAGIVAIAAVGYRLANAAPGADDPVQQEIKQFQGSWRAVAVQHADGSPAMTEEVAATRLVVAGNKFTLTNKQINVSGTFSVNPAHTPKSIDVVLKTADGPDVTVLGIYTIRGDVRESCFALPGKDRPTRFMSDSGYFGFTWRRN